MHILQHLLVVLITVVKNIYINMSKTFNLNEYDTIIIIDLN